MKKTRFPGDPKRRKCPDCGRIATVRADRFTVHTVYKTSAQICEGSYELSLGRNST